VKVYATPAVKPEKVIVPPLACEIVPVLPPGDEVAVYVVITVPPSESGASNETSAVVGPVDIAVTEFGALGTDAAGAAAKGEKLVVTPQTCPFEYVREGNSTHSPPA
jgi:hypothetical protein